MYKTRLRIILLLLLWCLSFAGCGKENDIIPNTQYNDDSMQISGPLLEIVPENTVQPEPEQPNFSVLYIDVGQGDAALVSCEEQYMLIDGGGKKASQKMYSILKSRDIRHLNVVVGTHPEEDHIGGIPGAFSFADADVTLSPVTEYSTDAFRNFYRYATQKGGGITIPRAGDTYTLGSAVVTILGLNEGSSSNDSSIVLRVDYGATSFLFTGDAEAPEEYMLLQQGIDLSATVLKVGHHGSDTSTTASFLEAASPEVAVVSVGGDNPYGHPDLCVLNSLRGIGCELYRTDLQGDIFIESDGCNLSVTTQYQTSQEKLFAPPQKDASVQITLPEENQVVSDG